jgi:hypothetical protein
MVVAIRVIAAMVTAAADISVMTIAREVESLMVMTRTAAVVMVTNADALLVKAYMVIDLAVMRGDFDVWPSMVAGRAAMVLVLMMELATIAMGRLIERDQCVPMVVSIESDQRRRSVDSHL